MPHDHEHRALEDALRTALTRDGAHPELGPAALGAFREARDAGLPTRRRDDWAPATDRRLRRRALRAVLAGLLAGLTLGGAALASGDLPSRLGDGPAPDPDPTTTAPHRGTGRPVPRPPRPEPPAPTVPDPDADREERDGKARGAGHGRGQGRAPGEPNPGADRGAKNGWLKNGKAARPALKPGETPGRPPVPGHADVTPR
ncbi:hypothetical protein [Streptomyces sp. NPDC051921]|uniref:hypothetical protein n=1 Tax=Streptomyces sp. NPDC051921 TaxID=3155806 RepID=UPI00341AA6DB